ncbi:MAG: YcxB family protein [Methylobacterium frigidaeris]
MPAVPVVPAPGPAAHPPLIVEAPLGYDDRLAGHLHVQGPRLARQRRRILTVGLPFAWSLAILGTVSLWATAGGRRDFGAVLRDLPRFDPLPLALCLAAMAAILLVYWAAFPAQMRRQMRGLMGPPGRDGPVTVRYRLDRDGLTQTLPGLASFIPWGQVRDLGEDDRHLFVATALGEEPVAIPKADLAPDAAEGVRVRVRNWAGRGEPPAGPPAGAESGSGTAIRVGVDLTAAERATLIARALSTPAARRSRLVGAAAWTAGLSLLYPGLLAVLWCIDPYRVPLGDAVPLFVEMIGTDFWQPAAGAACLVALTLAVNRLLRRRAVLALAEEVTAEQPPGETEALVGEDGIATHRAGARARMAWSLFRGCERDGGLMILPMRWGSVLPLPVRAFDPEGLARFEALAARHLPGPRGSA